MKRWFLYACLLLLFCGPVMWAQDKWDQALDRYERICEESLRLRALVVKGQTVPSHELTALITELTTLRNELRSAEGRMTRAQRDRFRQIRNLYSAEVPVQRTLQLAIPAVISIPNPFLLRVPPSALNVRKPLRWTQLPKPATQFGITVFCGLPEGSLGLMASLLKGSWGGYLKASSTLSNPAVNGLCNSDGTAPSGGYVWTSGAARLSRLSVSAGALWQAFPYAQIYAGAGYGIRRQLWEEASGEWLEVKDLSAHSLAVEAGVQVTLGHFLLLAGASTIGFRNISADLGLGWRF
jgi:hypothetical protein